jgi:hypothetical protein
VHLPVPVQTHRAIYGSDQDKNVSIAICSSQKSSIAAKYLKKFYIKASVGAEHHNYHKSAINSPLLN